jgi:CDP-diacylglycerol--serine O-phosphatidyltransferase
MFGGVQREERLWRYLTPNLITVGSMLFGLGSIFQSMEGNFVLAGWLIVFAVLTDKIDGVVARFLRGTSELGVQLDSMADFINFGLAPPILIFAALSSESSLFFSAGAGRFVLMAACATWVLGAGFRLARFNVSTANVPKRLCFGVPTTLAAGILATWFLALLKYTPEGHALAVDPFGGTKLFPFFETPVAAWRYLPLGLFAGGVLMGGNWRMANLGGLGSRWFTAFVLANVLAGFILIPARLFPEFLMLQPTAWTIFFLAWGQIAPTARGVRAPAIFPRVPLPEPDPDDEKEFYDHLADDTMALADDTLAESEDETAREARQE